MKGPRDSVLPVGDRQPIAYPRVTRRMTEPTTTEAHRLVARVRAAAAVHAASWDAPVPDRLTIDLTQEQAEEDAYAAMAAEKAVLRRNICETCGLSIREPASLAMP